MPGYSSALTVAMVKQRAMPRYIASFDSTAAMVRALAFPGRRLLPALASCRTFALPTPMLMFYAGISAPETVKASPRPRWMAHARRLALLALVLLAALYLAASWYLAGQATQAERHVNGLTPASVGLPYEDVTFPSRDASVDLRGWYILQEAQAGVIIIVHGLDRHKGDEGVGFLELARGLHARNFGVLLFDLRGHGESEDGKLSGGQFEQQDVLGAFDYLVERGVPPERIGVLGVSLGAAVTLLAAQQEPRLRAVVAESSFSDVRVLITDEIANRTPVPRWMTPALVPGMVFMARLAYGINLDTIVPERAVAALDYPVLLVHSTADTRIPVEHSLRLAAVAGNGSTELWVVPDAAHARVFRAYPEEYVERAAAYFTARFQHAGSPVTPVQVP